MRMGIVNWLNRYLKRRLQSDRADAVLVGSLLMIPLLAIAVGICMQTSQSNNIKTERVNSIQDSTAAAVKLTDSQGSLNWSVVDRVVDEYEHNRFGKKVYSSSSYTQTQAIADTPETKAFDDTSDPVKSCLVDSDGTSYPQYKITLDTVRGDQKDANGVSLNHPKTVSFTRTQPTASSLAASVPLTDTYSYKNPVTGTVTQKRYIYRVVTVEIIDKAPNLFTGVLGIPCQKYDLTASSVTFAANSDTAGSGAVG